MTYSFEFFAPRRVLFGCGRTAEVPEISRTWGRRILVFTGSNSRRAGKLLDALDKLKFEVDVKVTGGEPTFESVRRISEESRMFSPDVVVAMGGGSVIDTAKAVAMLLSNGGDALDYAEVIGRGLPIKTPSLPFVAIPTTAGAGAEATRNAVLIDRERGAKVSLRSHLMLPDLVVIDPENTMDLPPSITAATGMDALSQLIEPFVSIKANPVTDALCREGITLVARSLVRACEVPTDLDARENMARAAWLSGVALTNSGLGAVHGFAAALGGVCDAPHGLLCARFLAPVCRANIAALKKTNPAHPTLDKYTEVARLLTGLDRVSPEDGTAWIEYLAEHLPLNSLKSPMSEKRDAGAVIDAALKSSSMKGNPVALSRETLRGILTAVGI